MWKHAEDAELLRLWPEHSASEIAAHIGRTRNAVIGRYHRINKTYSAWIVQRRQQRKAVTAKKREKKAIAEDKALSLLVASLTAGQARNTAVQI